MKKLKPTKGVKELAAIFDYMAEEMPEYLNTFADDFQKEIVKEIRELGREHRAELEKNPESKVEENPLIEWLNNECIEDAK